MKGVLKVQLSIQTTIPWLHDVRMFFEMVNNYIPGFCAGWMLLGTLTPSLKVALGADGPPRVDGLRE